MLISFAKLQNMSGPEIPPRFARALSGSPKDIQKAVNAPTFFISDFEVRTLFDHWVVTAYVNISTPRLHRHGSIARLNPVLRRSLKSRSP